MSQEKEGFFKKFHNTIDGALDDVSTNNFVNLETNGKRVSYLCSLPAVRNYDLASDVLQYQTGGAFPVKKNLEKAKTFKDEGNKAVQKGDWGMAMALYSQSMVNMPEKETEELSIVLANRSATLHHLERYEESLADIKRCLALPYPRHLRYKVYERKARILLFLKQNQKAIKAFQDTITSLDEANKLVTDKRQKIRTDCKLMLEILNKGLVLAGKPKDPEPFNKTPPKPKITGKKNSKYPSASEAIKIEKDDVRGRFGVATRDIEAGEILIVEKPHSGVLLGEFSKTHCQNCFMRCVIPLPCPRCPNVVFCSDKCSEEAQSSYHAYECHILPLLWKSGCSITCHIALRMITQKAIGYFKNADFDKELTGPYKTEDYKTIYNLLTHEEKRTKQDFIHRTEMTAFLVKLLEISGYFDGKKRVTPVELDELKSMGVDDKFKDEVAIIGGLILRNLQVLQCNAHEIFELQCPKPKPNKNVIKHDGKSVFIAGGVFPTVALLNHSCDPSVIRYFIGANIVVRAVKNIKQGEEVSENYGPIFTSVLREKRRATLKDQYWFDCACLACNDNWPSYDDMNENYMRFRCDSDQPCSNVVAVPYDCKEFMVQCGLCQQHTNILKGLKSLQDTEMLTRLGLSSMEEGKYGEAIKKFIEVLKLYDTTLVPPYRSYYDCVQNLRRSMLSLGNYSIV